MFLKTSIVPNLPTSAFRQSTKPSNLQSFSSSKETETVNNPIRPGSTPTLRSAAVFSHPSALLSARFSPPSRRHLDQLLGPPRRSRREERVACYSPFFSCLWCERPHLPSEDGRGRGKKHVAFLSSLPPLPSNVGREGLPKKAPRKGGAAAVGRRAAWTGTCVCVCVCVCLS